MDWINVAQDNDRQRAVVSAVMTLSGSIKCGRISMLSENMLPAQGGFHSTE